MQAAEHPPLSVRPFLWTKAQYSQMGDMGWFDDGRVELIDGEIITMSPTSAPHWTALALVIVGRALSRSRTVLRL